MSKNNLLEINDCGIYCPQADIYIDPWKPVKKALITHAHGDHARWGSQYYLAHRQSAQVLRLRLGEDIRLQTIEYGASLDIQGVKISFHPAGHITGSAQIRLEYDG
ncbi:MAG: DNA ligase-associated DEXH box helicase, partial [Bacteroidetes bacterium]|nr:DNA ligase-associated DEXH box helicase [Bacteroidota bacterium]